MAANRIEGAGAGAEAAKGAGAAATAAAVAPAAGPGGIKAWVPMLVTLITMPALAYAMTTLVLLPKLRTPGAGAAPASTAHAPATEAKAHSSAGGGEEHGKAAGPKSKYTTQLNKVIVNVAGTMGTRFLVVSMTLVSKDPELDSQYKENEAELRHVAITSLSSKAISDIEKPGAKNVIRSELASLFNAVLGNGMVQEIYFTDFAIQ